MSSPTLSDPDRHFISHSGRKNCERQLCKLNVWDTRISIQIVLNWVKSGQDCPLDAHLCSAASPHSSESHYNAARPDLGAGVEDHRGTGRNLHHRIIPPGHEGVPSPGSRHILLLWGLIGNVRDQITTLAVHSISRFLWRKTQLRAPKAPIY